MLQGFLNTFFWWIAPPQEPSQVDLCETCKKRPKYRDPNTGYQHPFCGKTCASNSPNRRTQRQFYPARTKTWNAAGKGHSSGARSREEPSLQEISSQDTAWQSVVSTFAHDWQSSNHPTIVKILEISLPRNIRERHEDYRQDLESRTGAVELHTYYSSQCICDLGVRDVSLCSWQSCGICNVVKSSFGLFGFEVTREIGVYGQGIYTNQSPERADRFATSSTSSPYRVMVMSDVLVSRSKNPREPVRSSSGRIISVSDSERVFVSSTAAIVPSYVLLYTK